MRRGRHRLRWAQPGFHPAEERPQGTLTALQARRRQPQRGRHSVGTRLRAARSHLASGDPVVRTAPKPGGAVLHGRPPTHVQPDLADERQRRGLVHPCHRGEVTPRDPMPGAAHVTMGAVAWPLSRPHHWPRRFTVMVLGERPQGRVDLAVTRADLLVLHILEGPSLGHGQKGLFTPLPVERLGTGGRSVLAAILTEARPRHRVTCPGEHGPNNRHPGLPRHVADHRLAREVHRRQGLWPMLDVLTRIAQPHGPLPQITAPHPDVVGGAARAGQSTKGMEPLPPLAVVDIARGPPVDLLHLWRIDQEHLAATGLQELNQRDPVDPGRFQGDGRDPARGQPVGQGLSVDRGRTTAAPRLGIVTRGNRHVVRFRPHVDPRRMQVDGGSWGWAGGLRARMLRLASGHGGLRPPRGHRSRQWGRERRSCSPLPNGIRSTPVTTGVATGVATGSRDPPHQRAHRTIASTASHGPRPPPEETTGCAPVPCRCMAAQRPNHPHKG